MGNLKLLYSNALQYISFDSRDSFLVCSGKFTISQIASADKLRLESSLGLI